MSSGVTLANWRTAPFNIEAFHNIEKILPTQVVQKGDKKSSLEHQLVAFEGFQTQGDHDLASFEAASETDGIIVLYQGKIVYENYRRDNDASSKHILMSL